jgi:transposase InsO family protein
MTWSTGSSTGCGPNELWVTDITQHRTREGWLYCAAVLDAYSRRIVGWSIDSKQDSTLVVTALDMAIRQDPLGRPVAVVRDRRRRVGQRDDGKLLVLDADDPALDLIADRSR